MKKQGIIGIVGGMGPQAGIDLSRHIVEQTRAGRDQEHLPQVLWSVPELIHDRTDFLLGRIRTNPAYRIAQAILSMEGLGVRLAALACNSAHAPQIYDVVTSELHAAGSQVSLLHMVREVGHFIRETWPSRTRAGILGTTGTFITRQYDMLNEMGLETVNLSDREQHKLHLAIYHPVYGIKATPGSIPGRPRDILLQSMASLLDQGADLIVLGCTEFPLIYGQRTFRDVPVIDSSLVLARALIAAHSPSRLKTWGL
jgi:aspartate racemase